MVKGGRALLLLSAFCAFSAGLSVSCGTFGAEQAPDYLDEPRDATEGDVDGALDVENDGGDAPVDGEGDADASEVEPDAEGDAEDADVRFMDAADGDVDTDADGDADVEGSGDVDVGLADVADDADVDGGNDADADADTADVPAPCMTDADCDDGRFCTGVERCDPDHRGADVRGCVAEPSPTLCDGADDVCDGFFDACVDACDRDDDGHDATGECGGDDCDDHDDDRFPGNFEFCDLDHHDEDCDPMTMGARTDAVGSPICERADWQGAWAMVAQEVTDDEGAWTRLFVLAPQPGVDCDEDPYCGRLYQWEPRSRQLRVMPPIRLPRSIAGLVAVPGDEVVMGALADSGGADQPATLLRIDPLVAIPNERDLTTFESGDNIRLAATLSGASPVCGPVGDLWALADEQLRVFPSCTLVTESLNGMAVGGPMWGWVEQVVGGADNVFALGDRGLWRIGGDGVGVDVAPVGLSREGWAAVSSVVGTSEGVITIRDDRIWSIDAAGEAPPEPRRVAAGNWGGPTLSAVIGRTLYVIQAGRLHEVDLDSGTWRFIDAPPL